jgi:hypothetical protein
MCALSVIAACATSGDGDDSGVDAGPMEPQIALDGIAITEIAHFQGPKIDIMKDGDVLSDPNRAFAVAGKPSRLRVYFAHDANWRTRPLTGILDVTAGGMTTTQMAVVPDVTKSTDDNMDSTVNFDLPAEQTTADAVYTFRIVETGKMGAHVADPLATRWPQDGTTTSLDTHSSGDSLKFMLIPIKYNGDGSGRLPYLNQVQLDEYKAILADTYPVPTIDFRMHATVTYSGQVLPNGQGWDQILGYIFNLRMNEKAPPDVYYYGIFEPASSLQAYCAGGCVEGLALQSMSPMDTISRAAVGCGFPDPTSDSTMLQELAHNMGRLHANCGSPQNIDFMYPYKMASIGVWGYSLTNNTLFAPDMNKDFMSYCQPVWVSDYTYRGLFDRIKLVNGAAVIPGPIRNLRSARWDGKTITWGDRFTDHEPFAEMKTFAGVTGHYFPYDHLPGGLLIVPE